MMKSKISKGLLFSSIIIFLIFPIAVHENSLVNNKLGPIHSSAEAAVEFYDREWLKNNYFDGSSYWYTDENDPTGDISQSTENNWGNFIVDGDIRNSTDISSNDISGTPQLGDWKEVNNTIIKLDPDDYGIDSNGCWTTHRWEDGNDIKQLTAIEWDRNITLPVDMSDYNLTSVYLSAIASAIVHAENGTGEGIEIYGEGDSHLGDFVRFYVTISSIHKNNSLEIASYQPIDLGIDSEGEFHILDDTILTNVDDEIILYHLRTLLDSDPDHKTFTFTLGIRIWSEDNFPSDDDIWDDLRIESCDFSFSYEKKINKLTTASWNQVGSTFSSLKHNVTNNITLIDATIRYNYRISESWPTSSSPNAEIRVKINGNQNPVILNLDRASTDWLTESYNVKNLISVATDYVNFSIQLFLGDTFGLDNDITVSIDRVYLHIWYQEIGEIPPQGPPPDYMPAITALSVAIIGATIGLLSYIFYFQFPPLVRIIKKLRRKVKKGKYLKKPVDVQDRNAILKSKLQHKMQDLRIEPQFENALRTDATSSPPKLGINK